MGFVKEALGMIGDAATGGLASGVGSFVSGLFGGGGIGQIYAGEIGRAHV